MGAFVMMALARASQYAGITLIVKFPMATQDVAQGCLPETIKKCECILFRVGWQLGTSWSWRCDRLGVEVHDVRVGAVVLGVTIRLSIMWLAFSRFGER